MLSHWPTLSIHRPAGLAAGHASKFGGLPWGFPAAEWPACAECGCPMSFLAQFAEGPHLPRIGAGQSLFVFKCERDSICDFWEPFAGANACVVVPHGQMTAGFTPMPPSRQPQPAYRLVRAEGEADAQDAAAETESESDAESDAESAGPVLLELWVTDWRAEDDGVPPELEPHYYDPRFYQLPDPYQVPHDFDSERNTKAGGVPYWTGNGNGCLSEAPGSLVLQIDSFLTVAEPHEAVVAYAEATGHDGYCHDGMVDIANFCSDGTGYLMDRSPDADRPDFYFMILR
jgi:hypothetical protein